MEFMASRIPRTPLLAALTPHFAVCVCITRIGFLYLNTLSLFVQFKPVVPLEDAISDMRRSIEPPLAVLKREATA